MFKFYFSSSLPYDKTKEPIKSCLNVPIINYNNKHILDQNNGTDNLLCLPLCDFGILVTKSHDSTQCSESISVNYEIVHTDLFNIIINFVDGGYENPFMYLPYSPTNIYFPHKTFVV